MTKMKAKNTLHGTPQRMNVGFRVFDGVKSVLVTVLVGLNACDCAIAQTRGESSAVHSQRTEATNALIGDGSVRLAGEMDLRRLVDLCAERLRLRVDYDPKVVAGMVTLRTPGPLSDRELWDLMNQVLLTRGMTTVRARESESISVVKLADASAAARPEPYALDATPVIGVDPKKPMLPPPAYVALVITLAHAERGSVIRSVQPLLSKPGGVVSQVGERAIIVADLRNRAFEAAAVATTLDVPGPEGGIDTIGIRNMPARDMVTLATDVAQRLGDATGSQFVGSLVALPDNINVLVISPAGAAERWRNLIARLDTREPVAVRTYPVRWHGLSDVADLVRATILDRPGAIEIDPRRSVAIDQLSGSIIVTAPDRVLAEVEELLLRLEKAPEQVRRPMRTYEIRNRSAQEVLGLLRMLLDAETGSLWQAIVREEGSLGANASDGISRSPMKIGSEVSGVVDTSWKSEKQKGGAASGLVLTADDSTNTIIAIGEPRQLESIEQLLPTLDRRQAQVELEVMILSLTEGDTLDLGTEIAYLTQQGSTAISLSSLFGLSSGAGVARTASGIGGTALILDPADFAVVVRALQTLNKGRSLSMPRMLAGNNKPATINSVIQQPFTSTNASDTVATTSFGGTQDAGTTVTITPTIAAGDHVVLDYRISISAFVGESSSPGIPPPRQQNSLGGSVTIPDGHTIAIGGLRLATEAKARSQIPLLGDIPVLGEAFRNRSNSASESRFFVFIRANVLRHTSFEDLKRVSGERLKDAGLDDGLPVSVPRMIR
ncbi:MAG: hypothetical protein KIT19_12855 [Phycisphaeraceae bacterium]|nr:hypothetical protein [Phycisphaeraceae bacterium]